MDIMADESNCMAKKKKHIIYKGIYEFQKLVWNYYASHGRYFDWRQTTDPYHIVVSEIMLQQTQTSRVEIKFPLFIKRFPSFDSLASALLHAVMSAWQGLGYNRRGKYLHQIAKRIMQDYQGVLPDDQKVLVQFPGIGKTTAASIVAFAFNKPTVFIETNIRSVFLHHFFPGVTNVHDNDILPLIKESVDIKNPREWYYALMDYGVALKKNIPNPSRLSLHHTQQSKFEGSNRQVRGQIIRILTQQGFISKESLLNAIKRDTEVINAIIKDLCKEGLISFHKGFLQIADH
jgi:A/G-specific adenine glycosylase